MKFPLRIQLLVAFLAIIVFLVVGQSLVLMHGFREDLLDIQERELAREMELAPGVLQGMAVADLDSMARGLARRVGYPVTFLDLEGVVVGASSDLGFQRRGSRVPTEHPDVVEALTGGTGFARRRGTNEVEIRVFVTRRVRLQGRDLLLQVAAPLDEIDAVVRSRVLVSLGLFFPALMIAILFSLTLGRSIARPLEAIQRRARGLAAGTFSRRVPRSFRIKEIDELAETFNRLTDELRTRYQALAGERDEMQNLIDCMGEAVIALTEDGEVLTTNRAAISLLDLPDPVPVSSIGTMIRQPSLRALVEGSVRQPFAAREVTLGDKSLIVSARAVDGGGAVVTFLDVSEIRRLEMVRRDFVANASHELKTPLTAMRGFAETLLDDEPPEDIRRVFLESIRTNTLRLQNLVDDLLDLSRLETGGWVARREEVDLRKVVEQLWDDFLPRAAEKDLSFSINGHALALADHQGLSQIVSNLLDNAIRYTPQGGSILVKVGVRGPVSTLEVRDTGIGIPTASLPRVFERFFRVDPARSRGEGGTGLGLAIVRHLAESMGGRVWAESELGQGTSIFVTFPTVPSSED
jgi:signal transduction histidine kinase